MKHLILIALIALLAGCEQLRYGNVTAKWYEPAHTYPITTYIWVGKTMIPATTWVYDGEDWCISVKGLGTSGNTIERTFYITDKQYDTLKVGQFICIDGMCDEDENNKDK